MSVHFSITHSSLRWVEMRLVRSYTNRHATFAVVRLFAPLCVQGAAYVSLVGWGKGGQSCVVIRSPRLTDLSLWCGWARLLWPLITCHVWQGWSRLHCASQEVPPSLCKVIPPSTLTLWSPSPLQTSVKLLFAYCSKCPHFAHCFD